MIYTLRIFIIIYAYIYSYIYTYTHIHTHIYIYIPMNHCASVKHTYVNIINTIALILFIYNLIVNKIMYM